MYMAEARALLGEQVEVCPDKDGPVLVRGKLLSVCDQGDVVILDDNDGVQFCWPMLEIRARQ